MSTDDVRTETATDIAGPATLDTKLEVVVLPATAAADRYMEEVHDVVPR